jgi:hypothetical protein
VQETLTAKAGSFSHVCGDWTLLFPVSSLSLSLSVHVLEACIWVSLHSLLVHKSWSGEFVYEVELLAVEVSLNSLHVGKSFSQKFVCEMELAFEVP